MGFLKVNICGKWDRHEEGLSMNEKKKKIIRLEIHQNPSKLYMQNSDTWWAKRYPRYESGQV